MKIELTCRDSNPNAMETNIKRADKLYRNDIFLFWWNETHMNT